MSKVEEKDESIENDDEQTQNDDEQTQNDENKDDDNKNMKDKIIMPLLVLCWAFLFKSLIEMGIYIEYVKNRGNQICGTSDKKCFKARMTDSNYALNLKNIIMSVIIFAISFYCVIMVMQNLHKSSSINFNFFDLIKNIFSKLRRK